MARRFSYPVGMRKVNGENVYHYQSKDKRGNVIDKEATLSKKRFKVRGSGSSGG